MKFRGHIGKAFWSVVTAAVCLGAAVGVPAATKTWNNPASPGDLNASGSWSGGLPGNGDTASMSFTTAGETVTNRSSDVFVADSLFITNAITGNSGAISVFVSGTTFLTNGAGALIVAGGQGKNSSHQAFTSVVFSNNVTFNTASFNGGTSDSSATLSFAAGTVTGSNLTFTGNSAAVGNWLIITAPTVNLSSNLTMTGGDGTDQLIISNSTVTVGKVLSVTAGSDNTTPYFIVTNATLVVSNGVVDSSGRLDINNLGVLNVTKDWTNNGVLNVTAGGTVIGGNLTNQGNGVITGTGFIDSALVNQGSMNWGGTISNNFSQTQGTNFLSGNATITGNATISGGIVNLNGKNLTNGLLVISGTGLLTNNVAGATLNGGITNAATVNFASDVYVNGPVTNTGTWIERGAISNNVVNSGTMVVISNNIAARITGSLVNSGSLSFSNSFVSGVVSNSGSFLFSGAISNNYVQTAGSLTLNNTATITGNTIINAGTLDLNGKRLTNGLLLVSGTGVVTNNVAGATVNGGVSNASVMALTANTFFNGPVTNTGALFLQGTVSNNLVNAGTVTLNGDSVVTGSAVINGGSLNLNGMDISGGQVVVGAGGLLTNGAIGGSVSSGLTNAGTVFVSQNTFFNGVVTNTGAFSWLGAISNNYVQTAGTNTLNGNATITLNATINGGLFNLNGQTYSNNLMIVAGAGLLTNGVAGATVNGGLSNAATVAVTANTFFNGIVTNTGAFFFQGAISNNFVNSGNGAVTLNNTATITKTVTINEGTFNLNGQTISNGLMIVGGAAGVLTNGVAGATVNGGLSNAATVAFTQNTFINGTVTNTGTFLYQGALSNNFVNSGAGAVTLNNTATITKTASITGGSFNLNGQSYSNGLMVISGTGVLTNGSAAAVFNGGLSNAATVAFSAADVTFNGPVTNTGTFNYRGTINNNFVGSAGAVMLNNNATITGVASITGGSFNLNGQSYSNGLMVVSGSGLLTNAVDGATFNGGLSNAATVAVTGDTFFNGPVTNTSAMFFQGAISNSALVNSGSFNLNDDATLTVAPANNGTINVAANTLTVVPAWANAGSLQISGGVLAGGTVTNNSGEGFLGFGTISNQVVNNGTLTASGGTLTLVLAPVNNGTAIVANASVLNVLPAWTNTGVLSNAPTGALSGGTLTNTGTINGGGFINPQVINQARLNFGGTISNNFLQTAGSFTVNGGATITGNATINGGVVDLFGNRLTSGPLLISSTGMLSNSVAGASFSGVLSNAGTVGFAADAFVSSAVTNTGTWTQRGAISNNVNNSGVMSVFAGAGNSRITGAVLNSGSLTFDSGAPVFVSGVVTNTGSFAFNGAISNNLVNSGIIALNNTATVTGTASISAGTFDLNGKNYTNGLMIVSGTGVLTNAVAGATFNGGLSNATTVAVTANTFFKGTVTNTGTFALLGAVSNTFANSGNVILNGSGTISTLVNSGSVNVNSGTLSLLAAPTQTGSITVANGATVNAAQAWANNGTLTLLGGTVTNAAVTNNLFISGFGTIDGSGVVNNGKLFADASSISGVGTETVRIASFTNNASATLGTASTNAVLNLLTTGNALINQGTISLSGGTILFNGGAGTITNFNIIAGVGNVAAFPIVNAGTLASFVAQAPVSGLSNLIATVGVTNNGLLGANNFINGAATLSLTVNGGGAAIVNHGTVALQGGFLTINGGAGTITNISNGLIYGVGTQNLQVANLSGGTIMASNGVFSLGLQGNANAGVLSNRNAASTILLTNKVLVNNGTVALNGGGLVLSGSVITNEGRIFGPGAFSSSVYNDTTGLISATGGVLNVATNLGETVSNLGLITISSDGTLSVASSWLNTNGTVSIFGGGITGGAITNVGTVSGFGTISSQVINLQGGTLTATGAGSLTLVDAPTQGGWINIPNAATLNVLQAWLNSGTVNLQGGTLVGSTVTNAATITGFGTITPLVRNNGGATFTVTGGTMTLAIAPTQIGTFVVTNGGTLNVLAAWQNSGTVNLLGGNIIGSTVTNAGTITGFGGVQSLVNNGNIFVTNGTLQAGTSFTQNNTVDIAANSRLDVTPTWSNNGSVLVNGGFISGGAMTNTAPALLRGFGTVSNSVVNLGTILATNGTLNLVNTLSQSGTITIANVATFNMAQAWQNNGLVNVLGGILSGGTLTNAGTISGLGTVSAALSNIGYLRATNGLLSVQTLAGNQAAGILEASAGATLAVNGTTAWLNNGQLLLSGGTVIGGDISNNASKIITGFGTVNANVYNSGEVLANNPSQVLTLNNSLVNLASGVVTANTGNLVVNGTFTNAGTLNMIHSVGTFTGPVVNSGAWITDPTTNVFQGTYTVASSGFIQSGPGDVYIFSNNATTASSFINLSSNSNQYNTLQSKFVFDNTLGVTQQFATAGHDFGPAAASATNTALADVGPLTLAAYSNNFALGTLEISNFTTVRVTDAFSALGPGTNDGLEAALYLDNLYIGSNSLLLISGNVQLYFINSNNWSMANIELVGNPGLDNSISGIHQFEVIPEPSVVLLWLSGIATIYTARRRYARSAKSRPERR